MHTVRLAYSRLAADGLVEMIPGRGTFILPFDLKNLARQGADFSSNTIGVLIPTLNPFYTPYLAGLEEIAHQSGYLLLTVYTHDNPHFMRHYTRQLISKNVDGLIVTSPISDILEQELDSATRPPIVYVDAPQMGDYSILMDNEGAGFRATQHLISHGHQRLALITGPLEWSNIHECYRGFRRAMDEASLQVDESLIVEVSEFTIESGYQAAIKILSRSPRPEAVFAAGDILAVGVLRVCKALGLQVPVDLAIAGFNNIELASLVEPALTTVSSPSYQMGVEAMRMLLRLRNGEHIPRKKIMFDTELVLRQSCGCG
ncbi:MAG: hypothetical protein A2Z16_09855 [Chloroflexi bacterium RBG_16_54_18]|nr:MAG: hypothetical protein A2Z16_09855 [Chloroflexi bacterium RBG_16_54_18]